MNSLKPFFFASLIALSSCAWAQTKISVCYNYSCAAETEITFSKAQLQKFKRKLNAASSSVLERKILANVLAEMYRISGRQSPIHVDKAGNANDESLNGSMDCIDHSTTVTRFLQLLVEIKALRYHQPLEPVMRSRFIFTHYSAAIEEKLPNWPKPRRSPLENSTDLPDEATPNRFAVDAWFVDHGEPPYIMPLEEWMNGGGPDLGPA